MDADKLKHAILAADDLVREPFAAPEWAGTNGDLYLSVMSGGDREWVLNNAGDAPCFTAKLLSRCFVDGGGRRVFADSDVPVLARKSSIVLERAAKQALRLNKMGREHVEDEIKNSESAPI